MLLWTFFFNLCIALYSFIYHFVEKGVLCNNRHKQVVLSLIVLQKSLPYRMQETKNKPFS